MAEMRIEPAHTREMYDENQKKIRSLRLRLAAIALVGVVVIVAVLIWRSPTGMDRSREKPAQFAVTAVTLLFGGACLFYRGMRLAPLTAYARYLRELQSGLTREVEGRSLCGRNVVSRGALFLPARAERGRFAGGKG